MELVRYGITKHHVKLWTGSQ